MDLTRIILGTIVTEKAERGKEQRTYTLRVANEATKIEVKKALKRFYDIEPTSVRIQRVRPKKRLIGAGRTITKRHAWKKAIVTLPAKSKALDLVQFKTVAS